MTNFSLVFSAAVLLNVAVTFRSSDYWKKWQGSPEASSAEKAEDSASLEKWKNLVKKYLAVYLLATLSDWLQGPYVYALYADYGYSQHDIAVLFVAGFASSMVFGSFIGGMADWGGRRKFVILFSLVYAASCMTKHFKNFYMLMLGRLLGGVATSLLFSVFDAWLIRSHHDANLKQYLGKSFSWAAYGNSLVAILAGLVANNVAGATKMFPIAEKIYFGGYLGPFDLALGALLTCGFLAATTWEENFGETEGNDDRKNHWYDGMKNAATTTFRSTDILLCGIISSLFEGSMYVFVFMWTPALTDANDVQLPFGVIFSTFMVCCMAGSSIFSINCDQYKGELLGAATFATGAVSMAMIALTTNMTMKFLAMNLFEMTVGMYWPIMGTLKGTIVPESMRAAIYNLYRIPLNFIVLFSLLTDLSPTQSFSLNAVMLAAATVLMLVLMKRRELHGRTSESGPSAPERTSSKDEDSDQPLLEKDENV